MSLRKHLRVYEPGHSNLARACQEHSGRKVVDTQTSIRYLQLQMTDEDGRKVAILVDVDCWLDSMGEYLPGIPWQQVPLYYLSGWLNTLQLSFCIEECIWTVENIRLPEKPVFSTLLSIAAEPCNILCNEWPSFKKEESVSDFFSLLPLKLHYVLGHNQILFSELAELVIGDLLIITQRSYYMAIGQYKLFGFNYQGTEEVIVDKYIFDIQQSLPVAEESMMDWTMLPVELEFVLDDKTLTLGELNNISIGSILPVTTHAEQRIKIYLNRKLLAQGELVCLEDGGLAVEIKKINLQPNDGNYSYDAE